MCQITRIFQLSYDACIIFYDSNSLNPNWTEHTWNVLRKKRDFWFYFLCSTNMNFLKAKCKINVLEMHQNMSPNFSNIQFLIIVLLLHTRLVMGYLQLYIVCIERSSHFPNEDFFQYYFRSCTWLRVWITKFFLWLTLSTKELSSCGEIDMGRVVVTGGGKIAHITHFVINNHDNGSKIISQK